MSQGGDGTPTEIGPRFKFLKRGTGTKKYENINYITNKPSPRPSATSIGMPSTSTAEGMDPDSRRPPGVSRLNLRMSPTNNDNRQPSDRDSGRGSAAPQHEPIYSAPSNRRVDSGYGEYQNVSPFRGSESPLERTLMDDQNMTTVMVSPNATLRHHTPGSLVSTGDDDVFINESRQHLQQENNQNASLSSFIRHERDAEGIERTELSTPTRELQGGIRSREPSTIRSQSSACSDPYAPLTSTPIQDVTLTEPAATRPVPLPRRQVTVGETPILQATPSIGSSSSTRPPSSTSFRTPTPSFQMPSNASYNDSLGSERRLIAPNDRRLGEAFPSRAMEYDTPRNPVVPSQSTQLRSRTVRERSRQSALHHRDHQNENKMENAFNLVDSLAAPTKKPLQSIPDSEINKQLKWEYRNGIAYMDLMMEHLRGSEKKMKAIYEHRLAELEREYGRKMAELERKRAQLDEREAQLNKDRELFEEEKKEWSFNVRKEREALKKDREAVAKRAEENDAQVVDTKRESADYRVRMRKQADEIKKLKEEIEKRDAAKARSDKSVMQMKNTHSRQLKTMQDRIRELEQSRLLIDGELKKSRNGLKPRPQRATTTPAVASPPATREEEAPPPTPVSQRKEVRFDLENIDYREDSRTDLSQDLTQESYYEWYPEPTFANLPMGICYPIVGVPPFQCDESFLKRNYAYQVRHNEGQECGAFLYKFYNNDAKWIYGPVEAYLHHTFPLVVKLPDLGVEIRVIRDQVEIHRPFQEITRYDLLSQTTIDTRRRRDGKGFYAVKNDVRLGVHQARQPEILAGRSDRSREEDAQVIRRGNTGEKQEYMLRNHTRRELSWFSMDIHSNQIQFYQVHVAPEDVEKPTVVVIRVGIQNQFIDIISLPSMDFVYTRHRFDLSTKGYVNCCDFGKPARDRERAGEFIAFSPELPLRIGLISSA